ncbi:MAG TPA: M28 family peptidase, partial [Chryseolinea sp.]|nr:M28 family peptidase [Chryseolinea sp.]
MQTASRAIAVALILVVIAVSWVSLRLVEPPDVVPASEGEKNFSAERSVTFLKEIAKEPHPGGTPSHDVVRDYILSYCRQIGLETNLMDQTGLVARPMSITAGRTQNILARMKGSRSGKSILVTAHYDSQPNTPGAGDDGIGVAAMMESMRLLKNEQPLVNDILFLFTDLEECGLLGAEAFVSQYPELDSIGLIINLEARGNAGVGFTFEFSKLNGWMMREYSQAVERPYANSFAYEIYKMMPNDTDFSMFRETNISGFNTALINGYAYYQSMEDRVENLDPRSLQHLGDLLTQSLQHFGDLPLDNTKDEDMVFFTPIGSFMVLYPLSLDLPLMALAFVLWFALVILGTKKRRLKGSSIFAGMGLFIGFFVLSGLLVWGLAKLILLIYPHYTNFYSNNFYNATDYFWTVAGVVLLCFIALFKHVASKDSLVSVMLGAVFMLLVIMIGIKLNLNTGAYLIYYPVIILLIVYLVLFSLKVTRKDSPVVYGLTQVIVIVPALALWIPVAYTIYVVFSLAMPLGAVLLLVFCAPFLLPTLGFVNSFGRFPA